MYSSVSKGVALLIFISVNGLISAADAQDKTTLSTNIAFSVQPQQCVTLRQGRDCFATINLQWQKSTELSLCLYQINQQSDSKQQVKCWQKSRQGQISIAFESSGNIIYQLRSIKDDHLLAETEIVVSWLHKNTTRRRRWRLF
ncbi:hypothetical protein A9Q74_11070 [Colwellia sp. 39_35_sub15_T18]|nr:hypothetical protein A9Q74_11070 [Colwellia sp. 39_35_sub15_T18]